MTPTRRVRAAALVLALSLPAGLAGCATEPAAPSPTPTVSETDATEPVFASDEEALAAAVEAHRRYLEMSAKIGAEGGADPERILEVSSGDLGSQSIDDFNSIHKLGLRTEGVSTADRYRLVDYSDAGRVIEAYTCLSVEGRRILDADGVDRTPVDRPVVTPMLLSFAIDSSDTVIITGSVLWTGDDFCL